MMIKTITLQAAIAIAAVLLVGCNTPSKSDVAPPAIAASSAMGCNGSAMICDAVVQDGFGIIVKGVQANIIFDPDAAAPINLAAESLKTDLAAISGTESVDSDRIIIVGNIQNSALIQDLISAGKLDIASIDGVWEGFVHAVVEQPMDGVETALVIAGSDDRGTVYGIYDLSERMGVSPWHWWADVPIPTKDTLYATSGHRSDAPDVKYRGIFLNDENPALLGWASEKYGGFGDDFYAEVFELLLRLKGNYIWPAMWGKAYYDDDPDNVKLAADYGVVVGTSHHEPLGRAQVEWERYGAGDWDYTTNKDTLNEFWRGGVERMKDNDMLVTIGMRGDGDVAMTEGTAISLMEDIVANQRDIIADVTGKPAEQTPQVWALYKEVQDYYDEGMVVPDDVTLLFADDNWGNIRRLPKPDSDRPGGYGVYYHFDYVGGPRNHKWLNTTQIERVWEQMNNAREFGADRLWIVNVGDLKPMEFPISYFLDMAWDPEAYTAQNLPDYYTQWSTQQFGSNHAEEIGALLRGYTRLNARRKPELVEPGTFSVVNFGEAERVTAEWHDLEGRAEVTRDALDPTYHDAFDQLVWWPIMASANLNHLYIAAEKNRVFFEQGRASTNDWAARVEALFARDAALTDYYHTRIAEGKWNHFASQTHIGYTYWQQPETNTMPAVTRVDAPELGRLGVAIEGETQGFFGRETPARMPVTDTFHDPVVSFTLFNTGRTPIEWSALSQTDGVRLSWTSGALDTDIEINIEIDAAQLPFGETMAILIVQSADGAVQRIELPIVRPEIKLGETGFLPRGTVIAIDAEHYTNAQGRDVNWVVIPGLSRTGDGVAAYPVTAPASTPGGDNSPHLSYDVILPEAGRYRLQTTIAPSLDFLGRGGLRFAASVNDGPVTIKTVHAPPDSPEWNDAVADNRFVIDTQIDVSAPGPHTVKLWRVDPGVVFQRLEISQGPIAENYLGPRLSQLAEEGANEITP